MTAPVVETTDLPGAEHEPCCEYRSERSGRVCDRPAAWATRSRCCGIASLACDPCVVLVIGVDPEIECLRCGAFGHWTERYTCTRL